MNLKRYTNEDLEKAHLDGMKLGRKLIIEKVINISREFIHPKLINSFLMKLKEDVKQDQVSENTIYMINEIIYGLIAVLIVFIIWFIIVYLKEGREE